MTATVCMLIAVLVLSSGARLGGAVVCVGSDGHVDIEASVCSCCAVSESHDERDHAVQRQTRSQGRGSVRSLDIVWREG